MMYTDDKGELFIGPVKNVDVGEAYLAEVRTKRVGGSYHRIISWSNAETDDHF